MAVDTEKNSVPNAFFALASTTKFFHLLMLCRALSSPVQERREATVQIQQKHLPCVRRLKNQESYSALRRDGFRGGPTAASQDPARGYQEGKATHFPVGLYGRMRDSGCKLSQEKKWDRRKSYSGNSQELELVAHRGCGISILEDFQDMMV